MIKQCPMFWHDKLYLLNDLDPRCIGVGLPSNNKYDYRENQSLFVNSSFCPSKSSYKIEN